MTDKQQGSTGNKSAKHRQTTSPSVSTSSKYLFSQSYKLIYIFPKVASLRTPLIHSGEIEELVGRMAGKSACGAVSNGEIMIDMRKF